MFGAINVARLRASILLPDMRLPSLSSASVEYSATLFKQAKVISRVSLLAAGRSQTKLIIIASNASSSFCSVN